MKIFTKIATLGIFTLFGFGAYAEQVSLSTMFKDKKENEYAFSKKYSDKELTFDAIVDSIDPKCYTKYLEDRMENIPCAKLNAPDVKVGFWGLEMPIASALMENPDDLLNLKKKQKIQLTCKLSSGILWDLSSLNFNDCKINE